MLQHAGAGCLAAAHHPEGHLRLPGLVHQLVVMLMAVLHNHILSSQEEAAGTPYQDQREGLSCDLVSLVTVAAPQRGAII